MKWRLPFIQYFTLTAIICSLLTGCGQGESKTSAFQSGEDWPWYHGNPHGTHYSTLDQINKENVNDLKLAWTFDSADAFGEGGSQSDMQSNPLLERTFNEPHSRIFLQ